MRRRPLLSALVYIERQADAAVAPLHDTADPLDAGLQRCRICLVSRAAEVMPTSSCSEFVNKEGHCVFTPQRIGRAFGEMVDWVHTGKRPPSGLLP